MGVRITLFAAEQKCIEANLLEYMGEAGDPYSFFDWLRVQSANAGSGIRELSDGNRRWWMCGVLDKVKVAWTMNKDEYTILRAIFAKILQGEICGTDDEYFRQTKPLLPAFLEQYTGADLRIGYLDSSDVELLITLLNELTQFKDYQFSRPQKRLGIAPDNDQDWDLWVKEVIVEILSIQELKYKQSCIVSFVG